MSVEFFAKFPPSMDVASAVELFIGGMAVSEGVDLAGARVLLLSRLVKEGLESVADLRVAFDSVKEKRDLEVKGMFEEDTDPKLIESFSVFLDVLYLEDFMAYAMPPAKAKRPTKSRILSGALVPVETPTSSCLAAPRPGQVSASAPVVPVGSSSRAALLALSVSRCALPDAASRSVVVRTPVSIADEDAKGTEKAMTEGMALLSLIGPLSPRFVELYGLDGAKTPADPIMAAFKSILRGSISKECLLDFVRESRRFVVWLFSIKLEFESMGSLALVAYFQNVRARGKSVPNRARAALVWAEATYRVGIGAGKSDVVAFCHRISSVDARGRRVADPAQAELVPASLVTRLERLVSDADTLPLRIFCGVAALCTHGIKRWSDVQHVSGISLTEHAVVVTTWRSKKRKGSFQWAALRAGFSNFD